MNKDSQIETERLTVAEAAKIMKVSQEFLRAGLRQDRFPFGIAIKIKRYNYYIDKRKLNDYLNLKITCGKENEDD